MLGDFDASQKSATKTVCLTNICCNTRLVQHATPGYAAHEILHQEPNAPFRASSKQDVFSLGCVIYRMHMYPRSLRTRQRRDDDITDQDSSRTSGGSGLLPAQRPRPVPPLEQDGSEASPDVADTLPDPERCKLGFWLVNMDQSYHQEVSHSHSSPLHVSTCDVCSHRFR